MKNEEKYKTVEERKKKFKEYCRSQPACGSCPLFDDHNEIWIAGCTIAWLELEAEEEKPLPCPFCGCEVCVDSPTNRAAWTILCQECTYKSKAYESIGEAVDAHNRVAQAVARAKEREVAK